MSGKQPRAKSKVKTVKPQNEPQGKPETGSSITGLPWWLPYSIIFFFSCALYANTLWNKYTLDDSNVLTDNKFTKKGTAGIYDLFTQDTFMGSYGGLMAKAVSGGRYRPLSLISLAMEYEFTRKMKGDPRTAINDTNVTTGENDPYLSPALSHAINVLLFAFNCLLLYYLLGLLIRVKYPVSFISGIPFIATLLFAAHPIHTEAVTNIKGRDELMCLMFSLLALAFAIKYINTRRLAYLFSGAGFYFLALLSKENAITFYAIAPLTFFFFTGAKPKDYLLFFGLYFIPVAGFLILRNQFTGVGIYQSSAEILNNPFLLASNAQRIATTVVTFLLYFKLLLFPHPLTHDYYYNQIPYFDVTDVLFVLSLVLNIGLLIYALINLRKKTIPAYAILFYYITFSVVSNVAFTVGALMNERLVYVSSIGFCILVAYLLTTYVKSQKIITVILLAILSLYSLKTFTRNTDWKDNLTLMRVDVRWSPNSAKIQNALGEQLGKPVTLGNNQNDIATANRIYDSAIVHFKEAIRIYPTFPAAWMGLGVTTYYRNHKAEEVIPMLEKVVLYSKGGNDDVYFNLGTLYNESNNPLKARENLLKTPGSSPDQEMQKRYLLAIVNAKLNLPDSVAYWLKKGVELKATDAYVYYLIGTAFSQVAHNEPMAIEYLKKTVEMDPGNAHYIEDLGLAYYQVKDYDNAIHYTEKLLQLNPGNAGAWRNLSVFYGLKGNVALANQAQQKYLQLSAGQNK